MPWKASSVMEERLRFVARLLDGETMTDVCREFGISRKTGYKIFDRYKEHGLEALSDRSKRPIRYANQLPAQIETLIVQLKAEKPHWGARKIRELLVRRLDGDVRVPAKSTIHAILDRHGLVTRGCPRHRARGTPLSQGLAPNDLWCADFKGEFKLGNGRYCFPLTVSDHASRCLLLCEALDSTREDPAITAWERYRDAHMKRKGRNSGTIENYRDHMERLFKDWLDNPLARLGRQPNLVVERHDKITKENGPYIANGAMRSLRAVYNHARKSNTDLPAANPVSAIDWNKEHRRNTGMGPNDISGWLQELYAMDNPLRREFHLLTLFSGSRPTALKKVRMEHIDLRGRLIHIPKPKGGEEKAFDIPLSRPMIRCIIRAIRWGRIMNSEQGKSWLFPAESEPRHLVQTQ